MIEAVIKKTTLCVQAQSCLALILLWDFSIPDITEFVPFKFTSVVKPLTKRLGSHSFQCSTERTSGPNSKQANMRNRKFFFSSPLTKGK